MPLDQSLTKQSIAMALAAIPEGKRGALLLVAGLDGRVTAQVAAKLGEGWKVAVGGAYDWHERKAAGFVGIEGSW